MTPVRSKITWLPGLATVLSLIACYGTLAVFAVLGALGVAIALNETLWAGAIVTFAGIAVGGFVLGFSRHRRPWPLLIGGLGAAAIVYVMYVSYSLATELTGFVLLGAAAIQDWRLRRIRQPDSR